MWREIGATYNLSAMSQFSNFIKEYGLMDIPLSGGRFTWCSHKSEATFCRLNRFLFSLGVMYEFPKMMQKVLPRSLLDHNAVV